MHSSLKYKKGRILYLMHSLQIVHSILPGFLPYYLSKSQTHWMPRYCKICEYFWQQEEARIISDLKPSVILQEVYSVPPYAEE